MTFGPVQLVVLGFDRPSFSGTIAAELTRLAEQGIVRVIDAVIVHKDANGDITTAQISGLSAAEAEEFGATVGALIGLGAAGEEGALVGALAGAEAIDESDGHALGDPDDWYVLDDIPDDSAAAVLMLEHQWMKPLRDAVVSEGGMALGDAWIRPLDLVAIGLMTTEEAQAQTTA
jgi:uncharacterized membrane protein